MKFFLFFFLFNFAFSDDCLAIFESKKSELQKQIKLIDEARENFKSLKDNFNTIYNRKFKDLKKKETDINSSLKEIKKQKDEIQNLISKNEKILQDIKRSSNDKLNQAYARMKDQAAADVLSQMSPAKAALIISSLEPKKISTIVAKMDPKIASKITLLLSKGPPFEEEKETVKLDLPEGSLQDVQ